MLVFVGKTASVNFKCLHYSLEVIQTVSLFKMTKKCIQTNPKRTTRIQNKHSLALLAVQMTVIHFPHPIYIAY